MANTNRIANSSLFLVTQGIVMSGYKTSVGKPYTASTFGGPLKSLLSSTGIIIALDKDTVY